MVGRDSFIETVKMSIKYRKMNLRDNDDGPMPIKMKIKQEMSRDRSNRARELWNQNKGKLSDDELMNLSVKELNRLLNGLPPSDVKRLKHRRRTLKNRGYAANCRVRRLTQKEVLQNEKQDLIDENDRLRQENDDMRQELDTMKKTYEALMKFKSSQTKVKEVIIVKQEPVVKHDQKV